MPTILPPLPEPRRGVVTRFGKFSHLVEPGLNWKPTFIDQVRAVNVEAASRLTRPVHVPLQR
jgi:membrane protease subunit HflK